MPTPEIQELIQPLEQYMTSDQKSELVKILNIGKKWKELGEQKKQEFRKNHFADSFTSQIYSYPEKKKKREQKNKKSLEKIGYYKMNLIEKKKFEEQFIRDLILYSKPYIKSDLDKRISIESFEKLKKQGLQPGTKLYLGDRINGNQTIQNLFDIFKKIGGFKVGVSLSLFSSKISDDGIILLSEILEKTGGLREGIKFNFHYNNIGDNGIIALAQAIEKTGGLRDGVCFDFSSNQISDVGLSALAESWQRTGLKNGVIFHFSDNKISRKGERIMKQIINKAESDGINFSIFI